MHDKVCDSGKKTTVITIVLLWIGIRVAVEGPEMRVSEKVCLSSCETSVCKLSIDFIPDPSFNVVEFVSTSPAYEVDVNDMMPFSIDCDSGPVKSREVRG